MENYGKGQNASQSTIYYMFVHSLCIWCSLCWKNYDNLICNKIDYKNTEHTIWRSSEFHTTFPLQRNTRQSHHTTTTTTTSKQIKCCCWIIVDHYLSHRLQCTLHPHRASWRTSSILMNIYCDWHSVSLIPLHRTAMNLCCFEFIERRHTQEWIDKRARARARTTRCARSLYDTQSGAWSA